MTFCLQPCSAAARTTKKRCATLTLRPFGQAQVVPSRVEGHKLMVIRVAARDDRGLCAAGGAGKAGRADRETRHARRPVLDTRERYGASASGAGWAPRHEKVNRGRAPLESKHVPLSSRLPEILRRLRALIASSDLVGDLIAQSPAKDPLQSPFKAFPTSPSAPRNRRLFLRGHPLHGSVTRRHASGGSDRNAADGGPAASSEAGAAAVARRKWTRRTARRGRLRRPRDSRRRLGFAQSDRPEDEIIACRIAPKSPRRAPSRRRRT